MMNSNPPRATAGDSEARTPGPDAAASVRGPLIFCGPWALAQNGILNA